MSLRKSLLNFTYLENTGYSQKDFPILEVIMIDLYNPLIAVTASFLFVWTIISLEERTVRY